MFASVVPEPPTAFELYDDSWLDASLAADARADTANTPALDEGSTLTGPDVARTLCDVLDSSLLLAASSWPVPHLSRSRGCARPTRRRSSSATADASGIDGLLATAWGSAPRAPDAAYGDPRRRGRHRGGGDRAGGTAYALVGDLAFLHDHNGRSPVTTSSRPEPGDRRRRQRRRRDLRPARAGRHPALRARLRHAARPRPREGRGGGRVDHVCTAIDVTALVAAMTRRRRPAAYACGHRQGRRPRRRGPALRDLQTDVSAPSSTSTTSTTPAPG